MVEAVGDRFEEARPEGGCAPSATPPERAWASPFQLRGGVACPTGYRAAGRLTPAGSGGVPFRSPRPRAARDHSVRGWRRAVSRASWRCVEVRRVSGKFGVELP